MTSFLQRTLRVSQWEPWQRAQFVVVLTVALAQVAFDLTQPFIPLYVRYLGVDDLAEAAFWSGVAAGLPPLCAAAMGPVWGALADRHGRKSMVVRAMVMIGIMQFASSFVPDVHWLIAARFVMGLFAGFTPMVMALAISICPRDRMAQAIGLVQAAQLAPTAIGPTIGGLISDHFDLRLNFAITGFTLVVPALLLYALVDEKSFASAPQQNEPRASQPGGSVLSLLALPGFASALGIVWVTRFTDRDLPPILPLYLIDLHTPAAQIATITGVIVSSGAVAAAASSVVYGRRMRPENSRRLLLIALVGGALLSVLLSLAASWPQVLVFRVVLGLLAGGSMSLAYAIAARMAPAERSGLALSVVGSCALLGGAASPLLAGLLGQAGLQTVFLVNAAVYLLAVGLTLLPGLGHRPSLETRTAPES
ncbi:MAG: MFS transporter [Chloroflexi bacterium]|nr:MFS transporter [Chloroflexota bacterium]